MAEILIIGGGVAGLSAGIYSRLAGHSATVCERHFRAGGNLTGWQRGEYHIDNCIHWLTGTNPNTGTYKMWEELGALDDQTKIIQVLKKYLVYNPQWKKGWEMLLDCELTPEERIHLLSRCSRLCPAYADAHFRLAEMLSANPELAGLISYKHLRPFDRLQERFHAFAGKVLKP